MEKLSVTKTAPKVHEKVSNERLNRLVTATALALMVVVGGCGKNRDSLDKCLGEKPAKVLKLRMNEMKEVCHERVEDYLHADGDKRPLLRKDAEHACNAYGKELHVTEGIIDAKQDSARRRRKWAQRDSCKVASQVTRNRAKDLMEGDMKSLKED